MKIAFAFAVCLLLPAVVRSAVPSDERMKGPFLIASTPYCEDGSVDFDALVAEAEYMDRSGCCGIIWPQSNDSIDLLTHEEKFTAIRRLVEAAKGFRNAVLTIGVNGTNTAEMLEFVVFAENVVAGSPAPIALASRPPTDGRTVEEMHAYFEALGKAAKRPVIVQSLVNDTCPDPEVDFLVDLARRYPGVYGYIKEESDDQRALERQRAEVRAKPVVKTVFSAMGGWMWLYQARQCGTEGLVSERPAYAPLVARIWQEMKTGDRDGNLQALYAMYRYMIDQRAIPVGSLRGYSLYYLKKLGLFKTTLSRTYLKSRETNAGNYGSGHVWKLVDLKLSDADKAELDANFEGMHRFLREIDGGNCPSVRK